ncbi:MAG: aldo/keto reductase [Dehalococcoidia bacterium]|nr:aldo/keto reductase [Dehalococcoidia bacterium]
MQTMENRRLGRTDLQVSLVGLGTGGPSNLGQNTGVSPTDASNLVRHALDLGINLIDTSEAYGESEAILGQGLRGVPRERYVLATKFFNYQGETGLRPAGTLTRALDGSLQRLGVDYVDVYQLHGVRPGRYQPVVEQYLPELRRCQEQGKCRFLGLSEFYMEDGPHATLRSTLADEHFDTIMVGYNLLGGNARRFVLPEAHRRDVGVLVMFAVRQALSRPDALRATITELKARGVLAPDAVPDDDPLGWLVHDDVPSVVSAAYKFAAAHPAVSSVLTGTGNREHLEENVRSMLGPPLPAADYERLLAIFGPVNEPVG